jgi:hypothetical protein
MHKRYGKDGLVCLSVSVDDAQDASRKEAALGFLQKVGATFPNLLLQEETDFWQAKFKINGPPAVFVFDRQGKRAGKFDTSDPDKPFTYKDVENLVQELLREKP